MWQIVGQERAVTYLGRSLKRGTFAHAHLLVGPHHVGKMTLAVAIAQALNCEATPAPCGECAPCQRVRQGKHADVQVIGLAGAPSQAEIGIDRIREVQHSSSLPPFEGRCRVFIIDGAEHLSTEAANCLLKTLEEPAGGVFILLTTDAGRLLPTVVSRCQTMELMPPGAGQVEAALAARGVEPVRARLISRLSRGLPGWAILAADDGGLLQKRAEAIDRLIEVMVAGYDERFAYAAELGAQFGQDRGLIFEALDLWSGWWRDLMLVKAGCGDQITNVDRLGQLAEMARNLSLAEIVGTIRTIVETKDALRQNAGPRLALEVLMLAVPGRERQHG